jgi:hypothetical protein
MLVWSDNEKITWNDFKPTKWQKKGVSATIKTSIWCNINIDNKTAKVFAYMNKNKSRALDTIPLNKTLLRHEQYHFNITEYYARLFRKELIALGENKINKNTVLKLLKEYETQLNDTQKKYDSITKHGKDLIEQPLWEVKIRSLLDKIEDYKNYDLYSYSEF